MLEEIKGKIDEEILALQEEKMLVTRDEDAYFYFQNLFNKAIPYSEWNEFYLYIFFCVAYDKSIDFNEIMFRANRLSEFVNSLSKNVSKDKMISFLLNILKNPKQLLMILKEMSKKKDKARKPVIPIRLKGENSELITALSLMDESEIKYVGDILLQFWDSLYNAGKKEENLGIVSEEGKSTKEMVSNVFVNTIVNGIAISKMKQSMEQEINQDQNDNKLKIKFVKKYSDILKHSWYYKISLDGKWIAVISDNRMWVFDSLLSKFEKSYSSKKRNLTSYNQKIDEDIRFLENLKALLNNEFSKDEIINIDELATSLVDSGICSKEEALRLIHSHNSAYYQKLEEKYAKTTNNKHVRLSKILKNYGYDINNFSKLFRENNLPNLEEYLDIISFMGISDEVIVEVLITDLNLADLEYLKDLLSKGFITKEFIIKYCGLLSEYLELIKMNVSKITFDFRKSLNELLFLDPSILSFNIEFLKFNGIDISRIENATVWFDRKLSDKFNILVEYGFLDLILNDPNILDISYQTCERIKVARQITRLDGKELLEYAKTKLSFVKSSDDYLYSHVSDVIPTNIKNILENNQNSLTPNEITSVLEAFSENEITYRFGEIVISKAKVFNNVNKLLNSNLSRNDILVMAIIYNSELDLNQINMIKANVAAAVSKAQKQLQN